jgi:hypothetical protein
VGGQQDLPGGGHRGLPAVGHVLTLCNRPGEATARQQRRPPALSGHALAPPEREPDVRCGFRLVSNQFPHGKSRTRFREVDDGRKKAK